MAKIDKKLAAALDGLNDDQIDRKVAELKVTIPELNLQLDYVVRLQRERRHAAVKRALDDARRNPT